MIHCTPSLTSQTLEETNYILSLFISYKHELLNANTRSRDRRTVSCVHASPYCRRKRRRHINCKLISLSQHPNVSSFLSHVCSNLLVIVLNSQFVIKVNLVFCRILTVQLFLKVIKTSYLGPTRKWMDLTFKEHKHRC